MYRKNSNGQTIPPPLPEKYYMFCSALNLIFTNLSPVSFSSIIPI